MEPAKAKPFYKKIQTLGKGQYGKAVLVQNTGTNEMLVMKAVDIAEMTAEEKRDSIKEARILEALFHPNIVGFKEVYATRRGMLNIVMEYCDDGDLA